MPMTTLPRLQREPNSRKCAVWISAGSRAIRPAFSAMTPREGFSMEMIEMIRIGGIVFLAILMFAAEIDGR